MIIIKSDASPQSAVVCQFKEDEKLRLIFVIRDGRGEYGEGAF